MVLTFSLGGLISHSVNVPSFCLVGGLLVFSCSLVELHVALVLLNSFYGPELFHKLFCLELVFSIFLYEYFILSFFFFFF